MSYTKHFPDGVFHKRIESKKCTGPCEEIKHRDLFPKKTSALDGLGSECYSCIKTRIEKRNEIKRKENMYFL